MSGPIELSGKRVSDADVISEVISARAALAKIKTELAAVTKDRDELLVEYGDLQEARYAAAVRSPVVKQENALIRVVVGDVHGYMMDKPAVAAFLNDLERWQPGEIVLNGDIIECGGFLAAHHTLGYVSQTEYSWQEDIAAGNWFLDQVQKACPTAIIHYLEGNHEDRVERWIVDQTMRHNRDSEFLRTMLSPAVLLRLEERGIAYYGRGTHHIEGLPPGWIKLGKIFFVHELGGGKNNASKAVGRTAGNVCYGHDHQEDSATLNLPGVGLVKAWNPGCLCQKQPLWRHSNPTNWSHGYAVQFIEENGEFLHINIPIWEGRSLVGSLHSQMRGK